MNLRVFTAAISVIFLSSLALSIDDGSQASNMAGKRFDASVSEVTNDYVFVSQKHDCPNAVTQPEINRCALEQFTKVDKQLNDVYRRILSSLSSSDRGNLIQVQRAWLKYRDLNCKAERQFRGGSLSPTHEAFCLYDLTEARTKELIRIYETIEEGDERLPKSPL